MKERELYLLYLAITQQNAIRITLVMRRQSILIFWIIKPLDYYAFGIFNYLARIEQRSSPVLTICSFPFTLLFGGIIKAMTAHKLTLYIEYALY